MVFTFFIWWGGDRFIINHVIIKYYYLSIPEHWLTAMSFYLVLGNKYESFFICRFTDFILSAPVVVPPCSETSCIAVSPCRTYWSSIHRTARSHRRRARASIGVLHPSYVANQSNMVSRRVVSLHEASPNQQWLWRLAPSTECSGSPWHASPLYAGWTATRGSSRGAADGHVGVRQETEAIPMQGIHLCSVQVMGRLRARSSNHIITVARLQSVLWTSCTITLMTSCIWQAIIFIYQ